MLDIAIEQDHEDRYRYLNEYRLKTSIHHTEKQ